MENMIVGLIVTVALILSVRHLVRIWQGKGGCGCGDGCGCSGEEKKCCENGNFIRKHP